MKIALEQALALAAEQPEAVLHIVHVIPEPDEVPTSNAPEGETSTALTRDGPLIDTPAHRQLDTDVAVSIGAFEKKRRGGTRGTMQVIAHLRAHEPSRQIAQLASDLEVDLVPPDYPTIEPSSASGDGFSRNLTQIPEGVYRILSRAKVHG